MKLAAVSAKSTSLARAMARVPDVRFPAGTADSGSCAVGNYLYEMGKTQVTFAQWKKVYDWAVRQGYDFANPGSRGGWWDGSDFKVYPFGYEDHPVTEVNWRDCMVWCNALTEYCNANEGTNYTCVYRDQGKVVLNAKHETACDNVEIDPDSKGFRLPTSMEWELAARYIDGQRRTPTDCASGAWDVTDNAAATGAVAWYDENSGNSTHPVGQKRPNALGIYDMSGNVWEWCFDWHPGYIGSNRIFLGGSWAYYAENLQVGSVICYAPGVKFNDLGFRLARTL